MADAAFPGSEAGDGGVVLGLGNYLLSDEGVGVHAVQSLKKRYDFRPSLQIIDGGTMGLDLLPIFQDRNRICIIDAVDFGKTPGHVEAVEGAGIAAVLNSKLSVHHIGLSDLLFAAKLTRDTPGEFYLVGVQPLSLDTGITLSECVRSALDRVFSLVLSKLSEWNFVAVAKDRGRPENL
jgi:hydrogenase maturation protease